ncbi:hypothetical protein SELMODRAFT_432385 [Selaginella moellendorffii]|uniref:Uncharacterized protein n=1 Tax=Selaginella moellendorffii TaxID=88036 RepID=D8TFU5_SELML|nr:hypothetical protein SELMODRAFT_432385 [Selaginella moellendorffii]
MESALASLHAKCGMLFEKNREKDLVSRTVAVCAQPKALALIHRMELEGISPNGVTLSGCSHRAPTPGCSSGDVLRGPRARGGGGERALRVCGGAAPAVWRHFSAVCRWSRAVGDAHEEVSPADDVAWELDPSDAASYVLLAMHTQRGNFCGRVIWEGNRKRVLSPRPGDKGVGSSQRLETDKNSQERHGAEDSLTIGGSQQSLLGSNSEENQNNSDLFASMISLLLPNAVPLMKKRSRRKRRQDLPKRDVAESPIGFGMGNTALETSVAKDPIDRGDTMAMTTNIFNNQRKAPTALGHSVDKQLTTAVEPQAGEESIAEEPNNQVDNAKTSQQHKEYRRAHTI